MLMNSFLEAAKNEFFRKFFTLFPITDIFFLPDNIQLEYDFPLDDGIEVNIYDNGCVNILVDVFVNEEEKAYTMNNLEFLEKDIEEAASIVNPFLKMKEIRLADKEKLIGEMISLIKRLKEKQNDTKSLC